MPLPPFCLRTQGLLLFGEDKITYYSAAGNVSVNTPPMEPTACSGLGDDPRKFLFGDDLGNVYYVTLIGEDASVRH